MFDFAKLRIRKRHYRTLLRGNPLLSWRHWTYADGQAPLNCTHLSEWDGWTLYASPTEVIELRGSFHNHYHGGTNWRPFTYPQLCASVEALCDALGVFAGELRIVNLEIGINVRPPLPTTDLLPLALFHGKQRPVEMKGTDRGIVFNHLGRYRLKLYDKGYQYPEAGEVTRFEIHIDRKAIYNAFGIRNVQDLTKREVWEQARLLLLRKFDEMFLATPANAIAGLRPAQQELVDRATDLAYWMALTPNKRHRKRQRVEAIYRKYVPDYPKTELRRRIEVETRWAIDSRSKPLRGDVRRTVAEVEGMNQLKGGTFDAMRAHALRNTRVIHHHYGLN